LEFGGPWLASTPKQDSLIDRPVLFSAQISPGPSHALVVAMSASLRPETVTLAAIKFADGRIFTGVAHFEARDEAINCYRSRSIPLPFEIDEGFVTSHRRYLDRHDAAMLMGLEDYTMSSAQVEVSRRFAQATGVNM